MKPASACGADLATDIAVVAGSWIYAVLISAAIANQWFTLNAIRVEVGHQRAKVARDYPSASSLFEPVFTTLSRRIVVHRVGLLLVSILALAGAGAATFAEGRLVAVNPASCLQRAAPPLATSKTT